MLAFANTAVGEKLADAVGPIVYGRLLRSCMTGAATSSTLNSSPVQSVVSVVEYDNLTAATLTAETNASKPDTAYVVDTTAGKLTRRQANGSARFPIGVGNIAVTYVAGRVADTTKVDERYKTAAALMLKNVWRAWENALAQSGEYDLPHLSFPSFFVPKAVKELLGDQWRSGSGVGE